MTFKISLPWTQLRSWPKIWWDLIWFLRLRYDGDQLRYHNICTLRWVHTREHWRNYHYWRIIELLYRPYVFTIALVKGTIVIGIFRRLKLRYLLVTSLDFKILYLYMHCTHMHVLLNINLINGISLKTKISTIF